MKRRLLRCMSAVATVLLASSCTSELALEGVPQSGVVGEEVEVTFSVSAQSASAAMRTDQDAGGPGQWQEYIGRGQNIGMLIYAVYEENEDGSGYTLLEQYGQGYTGTGAKPTALGSTPHAGQTIINVGDKFKNGEAEEITLRLMRNKTYHIAFWAQNSGTEAYDTDDLTKVEVDYKNAKNNDELRDAFCKVEIFSVAPNASTRTVILTRPLAQINVGGTNSSKAYSSSKIVLTGVSSSINVVADEISTQTTTATFGWNDFAEFKKDDENGTLKIDFDNDGDIDGKTKDTEETVTETYQYLSMCYALVPATTEPKENNFPEYASSVLDKVEFYLDNEDEKPIFDISSVPVHRNWRTNILWTETDPEDPFYGNPTITVELETGYEGEYNGYEGGNNQWEELPGSGLQGN